MIEIILIIMVTAIVITTAIILIIISTIILMTTTTTTPPLTSLTSPHTPPPTLGMPEEVVIKNYRRDGSAFWNLIHIMPVSDVYGKVRTYIHDLLSTVPARTIRLIYI